MGLGMNAEELRKNSQLTESVVQDLNKDPKLPFEVKRVFFFFSISSMEKNLSMGEIQNNKKKLQISLEKEQTILPKL